MSWPRFIVFTLSGLLVLCLLVVVIVTTTPMGLRCLFHATEYFVPTLKAEKITGSLIKGFTVEGLSLTSPAVDMDIKSLSARITLGQWSKLAVSNVMVDEPRIRIKAHDTAHQSLDPVDESKQQFQFPIAIELSRVHLTNGLFDWYGSVIKWQQLDTAILVRGHTLHIKRSLIDTMLVNIGPVKEAAETGKGAPHSQGQDLRLTLPPIALPMNFQVDRLQVNQLTYDDGSYKQRLDTMVLSATTLNNQITLSLLDIKSTEADMSLRGTMSLNNDYPLSLELQGTIKSQPFDHEVISLALTGSLQDLAIDGQWNGKIKTDLKAHLHLTEKNIPFDISLTDLNLMWPLTGQPNYRLSHNSLSISGSLASYQIRFTGDASGADIPDAKIVAKGKGNLSHVDIEKLALATLSGAIDATAHIDWSESMQIKAALHARDIDLGKKWPDLVGSINGDMTVVGGYQGRQGWYIDVNHLLLKGRINNQTMLADGKLRLASLSADLDPVIRVSKLTLSHGENVISVAGVLDKAWDMKVVVNVPDIDKSLPGLLGEVNGTVDVTGNIRQPNIQVNLKAHGINYDEITAESIRLAGRFSLARDSYSELQLKIQNIQTQAALFSDIKASYKGSLAQHDVNLLVEGDPIRWSFGLTGSIGVDGVWQEVMTNSKGTVGKSRFLLQNPVRIEYAEGEVTIAPHCWRQGSGSICLLEKAIVGQEGQFKLNVNNLDLGDIVTPILPRNEHLMTTLNADVYSSWKKGQPLTLKSSVNIMPGEYRKTFNGRAFTVGWNQCALIVNSDDKLIKSQLDINLINNGSVHGQLTLNNKGNNKAIDGKINVNNIQLNEFEPLLPLYEHFKGMVEGQVVMGGTLDTPVILGDISVRDFMATGKGAPLIMDRGSLDVRFDKNKAIITGGIMNEGSSLKIRGGADWQKPNDWLLDLTLKGDTLKVHMEPMLALKVTPDLQLTVSPQLAEIKGNLIIPKARLHIQELPESAVTVSKDVVIVNSDMKPIHHKGGAPFDVKANVSVDIGKDVKIDAFGLKANLMGKVDVRFKDNQPVLFGEMLINDGVYSVFGQSLVIQRGRLTLNGPPEQSFLNIEAIRDPNTIQDDVTVGIRVTGTAGAPKITVFSDPTMPQQNALSYLLTGKRIDQDVNGSSAMTIMAISMGFSKSNQAVGYIGKKLGIKELALNAEGAGNDSQVTISGYITPQLQVKYGVGIYQALAEFTARYRLIKNLFLEAVTSDEDRSVDLLYQFSF